jgi:hypothetical protein
MEVPLLGATEVADVILMALASLFLLEQCFYWRLGSYPYRYGLVLRTWKINQVKISQLLSRWSLERKLVIRIHDGRREVYFRYRYPSLVIAPQFFAGQLSRGEGGVVRIRIGLISASLLAYLMVFPMASRGVDLFGILNSILVAGFIAWLWLLLVNAMGVRCSETEDQMAEHDR